MQAVGAESEARLAGAGSFGLCFGIFTFVESWAMEFTHRRKNNLALVLLVLVVVQYWLEDLGLLHTSA